MQTLLEREQQLSQFGEFGLDPSLVLYVPLWKRDASIFMSEDAYGHLCTRTGALWRPDGHSFDGDDLINLGTGMSTKFTNKFTILVRMKTTGDFTGLQSLIGQNTATQFIFGIDQANKRLRAIFTDIVVAWWYSTADLIDTNVWALVGLVYDGATWTFYINGNAAGSGSVSGSVATLTEALLSGYSGQLNYFTGLIDAIWLYNRALLAGENQNIYQVTK